MTNSTAARKSAWSSIPGEALICLLGLTIVLTMVLNLTCLFVLLMVTPTSEMTLDTLLCGVSAQTSSPLTEKTSTLK